MNLCDAWGGGGGEQYAAIVALALTKVTLYGVGEIFAGGGGGKGCKQPFVSYLE